MTANVHCTLTDGLMPNEKIAKIETKDGEAEYIAVFPQNLQNNKLVAFVVGKRQDDVLLELPRESASGRWRIWVKASAIGG